AGSRASVIAMTESSAAETHGDRTPPDLMDNPPGQMVTTTALGDSPAVDPKITIEALIESLEPLLLEIRSDVDASRNKSESTAVALEQMTGDLADMRAQMSSMSRTIVKSSKGFADVCVEMRRVR